MATLTTPSNLKRHQKVVATADLPGVPAGTEGKVLHVVGVTWRRYHVLFANGVQRANVDGSSLQDRAEWEDEAKQARAAERRAEQERVAAELRERIARGEVVTSHAH